MPQISTNDKNKITEGRRSVSTQSKQPNAVSDRYARAFFDLVLERSMLDAVLDDFVTLRDLSKKVEEFDAFAADPVLSRAEQESILDSVLKHMTLQPLTSDFLKVIVRHRRLSLLENIIQSFDQLVAQHRRLVTAYVTTARTLTDTQKASLKETLGTTLDSDVDLVEKIDESLLGGLVVRVGSQMLDHSLKTKLNNIHQSMIEAI